MTVDNPFPQPDHSQTERWDKEWLVYFATESIYPHLVPASELTVISDLRGRSPREVFESSLTSHPTYGTNALRVWCGGDDLVGRNIVEVGCGCGYLGKQLGLICDTYLGLDWSQFALAIARGASPANCTYYHVTDRDNLQRQGGSYDTMVGREFFIHQNFENANRLLAMGRYLLRPGGVICADFYQGNRAIPQGVIHPAKSPLDPKYPSCGFEYTDAEIGELATANGLQVVGMEIDPTQQRRFVTFRKP